MTMTMKFTVERNPLPSPAEIAKAIGPAVLRARRAGEVFEVEFEPAAEDEGDALFLMLCEIAKAFPGAVLAE